MFGLTVWEVMGCLVCAALFLYLLPYIVAIILIIVGIVISGIGLLIEGIGHILNKLFGGK